MEFEDANLRSIRAITQFTSQTPRSAIRRHYDLKSTTTLRSPHTLPSPNRDHRFNDLQLRQVQDPSQIPLTGLSLTAPSAAASTTGFRVPVFLSPIGLTQASSSPSQSSTSSLAFPPTPSQSLVATSSASQSSTNVMTPEVPKLRLVTFIPAFIAAGVFSLALFLWAIYRCCKRQSNKRRHTIVSTRRSNRKSDRSQGGFWKNRRNKGDGELVCGPKYVDLDAGQASYDDPSMDEEEGRRLESTHTYQMIQSTLAQPSSHSISTKYDPHVTRGSISEGAGALNYGQPRRPRDQRNDEQHQYRWPSLNQQPTFDSRRGFHVPPSTSDNLDPSMTTAELIAPSDVRPVPQRMRTLRSVPSSSGTRVISPLLSDATSVALQELYDTLSEPDSDASGRPNGVRPESTNPNLLDPRMTTPWESLRHKSIKRGILQKVEQDERDRALWSDGVRRASGTVDLVDGRKRKAHIRQTSDVVLGEGGRSAGGSSTETTDTQVEEDLDMTPRVAPTPKLEIRNPSVGAGRLGAISRASEAVMDIEDEDREEHFTPTQRRPQCSAVSEPRRTSAGQIRSTSPLRLPHKRSQEVVSRDILPAHPTQIMSPPLQNHILFLPPPSVFDRIEHSIASSPIKAGKTKSRVRPKAEYQTVVTGPLATSRSGQVRSRP
ncbi:hypothetical protein CPB83DRAFT_620991 [Crepidotus variabilis]|uniref:Uncharacterized protein n=1 Tax=Crepidotus variabilis TaxID=179855 RepID=A0A9P6E802_9AGAR|nr:hypothetical protein CPB83DRAFT_620991 [Crepidotus variabilis]